MQGLSIAFSGGGNWCIPQLGFTHAIMERGYSVKAVSGISFGTFSAYSAATRDPLGAIKRVKQFREIVDLDLSKPFSYRITPFRAVQRIEKALDSIFPEKVSTFCDYFALAVSLPDFKLVTFNKEHHFPRIVRAAMAMPPLPAAKYNGLLLRDAGLRAKYGIKPIVEAGFNKILCLGTFHGAFKNIWATVQKKRPQLRDVYPHEFVMSVVKKINPINFSRKGFEAIDNVFEEGYQFGRKFPEDLLQKLSL